MLQKRKAADLPPLAELRLQDELYTSKKGLLVHSLYMGVSENRGTLFWGPYSKDPTI